MGQFPTGSGSQSPQFLMKLRVESNHQRTVDWVQGVDKWMFGCVYFLFPFCLFSQVVPRRFGVKPNMSESGWWIIDDDRGC